MRTFLFRSLAATISSTLVLAPLLVIAPASAQETGWVHLDYSRVRLISADRAVGGDGQVRLGLQIKMQPGFKTYWRSPGDSGIPPRFDWSHSSNLARAQIHWPAPERFVLGGFNTIGYADEVVLPIDVELQLPGQALTANLQLVYGVCRDICVLGEAELALTIPAGQHAGTDHADVIDWFRGQVPAQTHDDLDISTVRIVREGGSQVLDIVAEATGGAGFDRPDILVEGLEDVALLQPVVAVAGPERRNLRVRYYFAKGTIPDLAGRELTLTLLDSGVAFETRARLGRGD